MAINTAAVPAHAGRRSPLSLLGDWLRTFLRAAQFARMCRVLYDMSDAELARVGVARADIPAYAAKLVGLDD